MSEARRELPPADAESSPAWDVPYAADPRDDGGLTIRNHHEDWRVEPEGVPNLLRACLEAYEDPETGMSGVEMVERAAQTVEFHMVIDPDAEEHLEALRRLLHDPEGGGT